MKKTFMFMLMAIVLSLSGFSQEDYVVGNVNATGSTQYAPSTAYYNYSISQSLYLDSDLEEVPVGTITAISYKTTTSSYETTRSWKIYLAEVDNTSITTSTYIPDDEFTEVFEGTVTITVGGWTTVELNEPFIYTGSGNLVIMVSDYTGSYVNNRPYYVSENVTNTCICYYSDNPSYTTPLTSVALASASITNRPIVKLTVNENGDYCVGVRGVTSSNITSTTTTISWQEREDSPTFYYQIKKSIEEWPEEDDYETTTGFSIDFSDLDPMTTYNVRVMTDCGDLQSNWRVVNFTTACGEISTMPYSVDFDNMPTGTPPECWTRAYNATYPQVYNGSSWAHTGTHTIYYWDNNMLSLPGIDTEVLDISELTLSLYAVANANDHAIEVGTCTNPMDSTTFTVFANFYPMNGSQATELYQIPFTGWEESMGNYIAIRRTDAGSGNLVMLDDISLDYTPACLIPTISLSNITGHAVTVTWTSNEDQTYNVQYKPSNETEWSEEENTESPFTLTGLDPETNYQVRVSLYCEENSQVYTSEVKSFTTLVACPAPTISFTGITPESATVSWTGDEESTYTLRYRASGHDEYVEEDIEVSGNTYDITGLSASTTYQVEVQANCGEEDGLSQWGSATFKTACGYLTQESLPYSDNVEGYVNFEIMDCWQRFPDNTYPRIVNNTNFSHSGTGYLFCGSSSAGTIETRDAVLPGYQGDITALQLDFYLRLDHIVGTFQVGVTTDPSNQDAFVPVYTIVPSDLLVNPGDEGTTFYTYFEIPFSGVEIEEAEVYYPVLREINGWGWLVDDVTLEVIPECSRPANVSTTFTSSRSVNISFASTGEEFALYYKTPTDTEYIEADVTFEAGEEENTWNVALEDLLSETTYSYYIQAICGETTPQSSVLSFTTPVTCPIPVVTIEDVTAESATISWTGFAESYNLRYKLQGSTEYIEEDIEVSGENTYTIEDLLSTHNYQVELQANCGDEDGMSGWGVLQFSTIMLPVDIPYSTDFSGDEETGDRGWLLNNSTCQNYWVMGTTSGYTAMYVTNDGTTAGYNEETPSYVTAEKLFNVGDAEQIHIEFDVVVGGEDQFDYMKVFFAPATSDFPASTSQPSYANNSYSTNALNFLAYDSFSNAEISDYPYTYSLTNNNIVHMSFDVENPSTNGYAKLVFLWNNDGSVTDGAPALVVTNVAIGGGPCSIPDVTVTNILDNSAIINLPDEGEYTLKYKQSSDEDWTDEGTINGETYLLENLEASTIYTIKIARVCEDENSIETTRAFTTACGTISNFTYTEGFEYGFGCWSEENSDVSYVWTTDYENYRDGEFDSDLDYMDNPEGNAFAFIGYDDNDDWHYNRLISPMFDISGLSEPQLKFACINKYWSPDQDTLAVYYRTTTDDTWNYLTGVNNSEEWTYYTVDLPTESEPIQISFLAALHYGHGIGIDDISIFDNTDNPPTPIEPTVVTNVATGITQTTATLNGAITEVGNQTITARGFEWKATVGGTYTTVSATGTTMTANLTGLTANTSYTYRAFATTGNGTQYGEEVTFTTLEQGEEPCTPATATLNETVCYGETFTFNGNTYNATGTYQTTVSGVNGECDTNYTINLTVNAQNTATETITVCYGETAEFNGQTLTEGENTVTVAGQGNECDTLYTVTLVVRPENNNTVNVTINPDELPYQFGTQVLETEGTYTEVFTDINGCDSTVTLNLTINSGINDVENGIRVMLYPNPTTEDAMLRVEGINSDATIYVTDVQGRTIKETRLAQGENTIKIETSTLASGVYYIRIVTDTINRTEKLIKK